MRNFFKLQASIILAGISFWMSADAEFDYNQVFRVDFSNSFNDGKAVSGWTYRGKLGTPGASYTVATVDGVKVLKLESRQGTGTILFDISKVDLKKYPIMRWKWRVDRLPDGADGRLSHKDDQPIGIYVGSGGLLSQTSVAFRWESDTPKNTGGFVKYGMGAIRVTWKCVRNKNDKLETWYVDECNIYKALSEIFHGKLPERIALTLSTNSQYTKSTSLSYLEYVEFHPQTIQTAKITKKED